MTQNFAGDLEMLRNLTTALQEHTGRPEQSKRPAATDRDILRAMLGKPWKDRDGQPIETRKAG